MFRLAAGLKVYLHREAIDGRKNINGLALLVEQDLGLDPFAAAVCLEYIVVHEMSYLLEPTHGPKFLALMDRYMPAWRETRALLNSLPARHERWDY